MFRSTPTTSPVIFQFSILNTLQQSIIVHFTAPTDKIVQEFISIIFRVRLSISMLFKQVPVPLYSLEQDKRINDIPNHLPFHLTPY